MTIVYLEFQGGPQSWSRKGSQVSPESGSVCAYADWEAPASYSQQLYECPAPSSRLYTLASLMDLSSSSSSRRLKWNVWDSVQAWKAHTAVFPPPWLPCALGSSGTETLRFYTFSFCISSIAWQVLPSRICLQRPCYLFEFHLKCSFLHISFLVPLLPSESHSLHYDTFTQTHNLLLTCP